MLDMRVRLYPSDAAGMLENYAVRSGMSTECVDRYVSASADGRQVIVLVFEKYYMRNSSRASLTVTIDNLSGETRVHAAGSGGGKGAIFKFDWGAADSFSNVVRDALAQYAY